MQLHGRFESDSKVIYDHDRHAEIGWQMPEEAGIGVESPGGTTYADQWKTLSHFLRSFGRSIAKDMDSEIARDQKHDHHYTNNGKYILF
jgi:hypothetical protein